MKRRPFSASYKAEEVIWIREQGRLACTAPLLGISESVLLRWMDASDVAQGVRTSLTLGEKVERDLKQEVATLKMERQLLNNSAGIPLDRV